MNSVSGLCLCLRDTTLNLSRWSVEGEDVEGVHEVLVRHPQYLTSHQYLISRPLLRVHHPLTFTRGGDPMVADHWFMQIEKVLEAMEITSDTTKIRLVAFQ